LTKKNTMKSLEKEMDLNLTERKIRDLELELIITKELLTSCIDSVKETQRFIMKLAYNQQELTRRVATWPFVVIPSNGNEDEDDVV